MLLIRCPWCGPATRSSSATAARPRSAYPADPEALADEEWADYLFMRDNPKGPFRERWIHAAGCRRWFKALRDTSTHRVIATYPIGEEPISLARFRGTERT